MKNASAVSSEQWYESASSALSTGTGTRLLVGLRGGQRVRYMHTLGVNYMVRESASPRDFLAPFVCARSQHPGPQQTPPRRGPTYSSQHNAAQSRKNPTVTRTRRHTYREGRKHTSGTGSSADQQTRRWGEGGCLNPAPGSCSVPAHACHHSLFWGT